MSMHFGDRNWAEATNGLMRRSDRLALTRQLVSAQLETLALRLGLTGRPGRIDLTLDEIVVPDSAICKLAEEHLRSCASKALNLHSHRTYFWGMILARSEGLRPDPETLYVAALLHDLGLTEAELPKAKACCFAVNGARQADLFLRQQDWPGHRRATVFDAISLHLNLDVPVKRHGAEARLLSLGAHLDVTGRYLHRISRPTVGQVLQRFPRAGFADEIAATVTAGHHPRSRAGTLARLGFEKLARSNPLDHP